MIVYPDPTGGDKKEGVRPPPQPPIAIRTMDSDVTSMKESGGGPPQEQVLNVPRPPVRPEPPKLPSEDFKIKIPGYTGPEKSVFPSGSLPVRETGTDFPGPTAPTSQNIGNGGGTMKKVIILIMIIVAAALVGAGFYFYVYPLLLQSPAPAVSPTPIVISQSPAASTPTPSPQTHTSLINTDKNEVASAISATAPETVAASAVLIKEIILKSNGNIIPLSSYLPTIIPELGAQDLQSNFDEDFTAFIYYDSNGAWPGYVLKRKQGAIPVVAQNLFSKIENSKSLNNLFLSDPGVNHGVFKNGTYKTIATHYLVFSKKGAAINYAWLDDRVIITTTYPAMQKIIDTTPVDY